MTERFYRREELVGKEVYDAKAVRIGTVKDVAYSIDGKTALVVSKGKEEETIPFLNISEIHDIILLKKPLTEAKAIEAEPKEIKMNAATPDVQAHTKENLLQLYKTKYPSNPKGVLEFHIEKLMREGMTEEQAVSELTKRNILGETPAEPKTIEPMSREDRLGKITATEGLSAPAIKTCPKCQRENKSTAKFCLKCGFKFA